ncbi:MAG: hypothetical protein IPM06_10870 [Rhizobiales bacterium]|nr:hypothetical protein [Hyphomicrobiales bacterium]
MGRFYWMLLFIASAIATHAAYVLYYPGYNFDSKVEAALGPDSRNTMMLLTPAQVARLFPAYAVSDIVAMCRYDLSQGPMQITAKLPRGYWTFSIFTVKGRQVYSLTDAQAGENSFAVDLLQAPDLIAQLKGALDEGGEAEAIDNVGWKVETPEARGIAVIWVPVADPIFRSSTLAAVRNSSCARQKS